MWVACCSRRRQKSAEAPDCTDASAAERSRELVLAVQRLHRRSPKGQLGSLRDIARELAAMGYTNKSGAPYSASSSSRWWRAALLEP